jgi:hypothetical protein
MKVTDTTYTSPTLQKMLGSGPDLPPALRNHPAQSATTIDGGKSVLFGLPFFAAGIYIAAVGLNYIQAHKHAPDSLILICAAMFSFAGLFLIVHGIRGMVRKSTPTYWEIEARGQAKGADYEAYFLIPVYKSS